MKEALIVIVFLYSSCLPAQDQPKWLVGGDIELAGETSYDELLYNFRISASGGYLIYKGLFAGVEISGSLTAETSYFEPVPLLRYYHFFGENRHAVYGGFRGGYGWGSIYSPFEDRRLGRNAWVYGARLGYLSFLTENVALDVFTFYDFRNRSSELNDGSFTERQLTTSFGLGIGLQIFL